MCNGLYLGAREAEPRPSPFWTNPAIKPIASQPDADDLPGLIDELDPNFTQTIKVTVKNQATYDIASTLDLYWSDPTTGFIADPTRLIETQYPIVPARDTLAGVDGSFAALFSWLPSTTSAPSTNGGHVCLLARTSHNSVAAPGGSCGGGYPDDSAPSTDFRSAIHNIVLVAGGWHMKRLHFAFAATNPLPKAVGTKLLVRPLIPERDTRELERLLEPTRNYTFASLGNRFGVPGALGLALGHERALARPVRALVSKRSEKTCSRCIDRCGTCPSCTGHCEKLLPKRENEPLQQRLQMRVPRLGFSGVLSDEFAERLGGQDKPAESLSVDQLPFEIRQSIVTLEPGGDADLYAFEVIHETTEAKPRLLGGLTFMFRVRKDLL